MRAGKQESGHAASRSSQADLRWARGEKSRALEFFKAAERCPYSSILYIIRKRRLRLATLQRWTHCALNDKAVMGQEAARNAVLSFIVEFLPHTFPLLERVLTTYNWPFWHEAQFIALAWLVRSERNRSEQHEVLALVEKNLMTIRSEAGMAAWKAGDMLGDEWLCPDTIKILERVVLAAPYVAGRKGAVHGIAHAIEKAGGVGTKRLLQLLRRVSVEDRSADVRSYAEYFLKHGGCCIGGPLRDSIP
jgi:hypothetical protein